jgi:hypothetical protein
LTKIQIVFSYCLRANPTPGSNFPRFTLTNAFTLRTYVSVNASLQRRQIYGDTAFTAGETEISATLADLYIPPMRERLLKAHHELDAAVEATHVLNGGKRVKSPMSGVCFACLPSTQNSHHREWQCILSTAGKKRGVSLSGIYERAIHRILIIYSNVIHRFILYKNPASTLQSISQKAKNRDGDPGSCAPTVSDRGLWIHDESHSHC